MRASGRKHARLHLLAIEVHLHIPFQSSFSIAINNCECGFRSRADGVGYDRRKGYGLNRFSI